MEPAAQGQQKAEGDRSVSGAGWDLHEFTSIWRSSNKAGVQFGRNQK